LLQRDELANCEGILIGLGIVGLIVRHSAMVCDDAECVNIYTWLLG
jgi:hypothetical protein